MSPATPRFAGVLLALLAFAGCGLDFSTPRAYRCSSDEECRGGWRCLGDAYCHDPEVGVATPCRADVDCAGGWRCLGDDTCHDPGQGASTPCQSTAECSGDWRCADGQCRDPEVGVTVTCFTSGDCLGGWYCGREKVCRDPSKPGAFACAEDEECAGGWRCSTEGQCVDAAAELALVGPPGPVPPSLYLAPRTTPSLATRVVSPAATFDAARGFFTESQVVSLRQANAVVARGVSSGRLVDGTLSAEHAVSTRRWAVSGAQVADFLASEDDAVVLFTDGGVSRGLPNGTLVPLALGAPVRRLVSTTRLTASGRVTDLVAVTTSAAGGRAVLVSDGGTFGTQVIDVVAVELEDGGPGQAWASLQSIAPFGQEEQLFVVSDFGDVAKASSWSRAVQTGDAVLSELRARGRTLAGAWRTRPPAGSGPQLLTSDFAQVLDYPRQVPAPISPPVLPRVTCPPGDRLVDFELVEDAAARVVLEAACLSEGAENALVYVATTETDQRLVLERRGVQHAGAAGAHARVNRWGVPRVGPSLREYELSPLPTARPSLVGLVGGAPIVVSEAQLYFVPGDGGFDLELQRSDGDPLDRAVGVLEGGGSVIIGAGAAFDFGDADGGPRLDFVLEGTPRLGRATARRLGDALVASGDDTLYAAQRPDAGLTFLRSVLRPAPGFAIDSWAARPSDAGYEGWLVANNQLFRLEANSVARWRSTPWPVQGRDVLGTWWAGEGARVGTATGEVLSLPSRVPVVPPVSGGVTSIVGWCGDVLATTDDAVLSWRGDAGWQVVDAGVPGPLREPRLVPAGEGAFVTDEDGVIVFFGAAPACP